MKNKLNLIETKIMKSRIKKKISIKLNIVNNQSNLKSKKVKSR
jgi:hypothetical protein